MLALAPRLSSPDSRAPTLKPRLSSPDARAPTLEPRKLSLGWASRPRAPPLPAALVSSCRYVSISAGVTTSLVIVSVHVINATGQWLYRLLAPTDADLAAEAAAERPPTLDVTEVVRPTGAVSETPPSSVPSVPGRAAAAAGKSRAPRSVSPLRFRAFFAVPVPVMWAALGLFLVAGIYFGAVFAVVAPDSGSKSTASRIAEDLQLTLSVGGSLGLVIGFWSFFINMSAERKRSPAELRADEEALLAAQLRERQFHDSAGAMDTARHRGSAGASIS